MKSSIYTLLFLTLIQTSHAKLDEDQIVMLTGDYELASVNEKFGECPLRLTVKYVRDSDQNLEQINLDNFSSFDGQSFYNLMYVERDHFSKFEELTTQNLFGRVVYETRIYPNRTGFVLAHSFQRQKRESIFLEWFKAWYKVDTQLNLSSSEITGNYLTVSINVMDENSNFEGINLECKYIKFLQSEIN